jgi:signal transduction histidine kinase/ketosteroid isomerase-like protein
VSSVADAAAEAQAVTDRFYAAINARDLDACLAQLTDDVHIEVDSRTLQGRAAARAYLEGIMAMYPGLQIDRRRIVAATSDTVVSEFHLLNPDDTGADQDGATGTGDAAPPWRLEGPLCEILRIRAGRVASLRSYYLPSDRDRTAVAELPSRAEAARIADEQAALRGVASGVARGVPASEIFLAVDRAIASIARADFSVLLRFEPDGQASLLATSATGSGLPSPAARLPADADLVGLRTGGTFALWTATTLRRVLPIAPADIATSHQSALAVPIRLGGVVWGLAVLTAAGSESSAADTAARITEFAEFVGPALAHAQAADELRRLAEEQAALRRVAELVARGAPLNQVFAAAAREASALLDGMAAALTRYTTDAHAEIVAVLNSPAPMSMRIPVTEDTGTGIVLRTAAPHRVEDFATTSLAEVAAELGVRAAVSVPVIVEGRVWGTLSVSSGGPPIPPDAEARLVPFADLAAAAIAAAQNRSELLASRARVLTTADETRRRVQRDVHDGAQQRLVHTIINLKLARDALARGAAVTDLVAEALASAERANQELRDVVRGILPAALTHGGLRSGIESLTADLPVPVALSFDAPRLSTATETTAYFVVAEALTNVTKHANSTAASVDVHLRGGHLLLDVRDNGIGGADPGRGSGLTGLLDRVAANDGLLEISSPPGAGTHLHASLPVDVSRTP